MNLDFSPYKPVLIAGPTASGKSQMALDLAARLDGVIINADALQVYSCWQSLSARPASEDLARATHLLYGHIELAQDYSVGHWLRDVADQLQILQKAQKIPIIVGGTGLYFAALTEGLANIPPITAQTRALADARRIAGDLDAMCAELDPATLARIDKKNGVRVQRAWEVWHATGRGLSAWQDQTPAPLLPLVACQALVLMPDVEWLNSKIDLRFDQMIAKGALDEVRAVLPFWQANRPFARAIGAPELIAHLQGNCTLEEAISLAKMGSRQYAKRQRTWFRSRMKAWKTVHLPQV